VLADRVSTGFNAWTAPDVVIVQVERAVPRPLVTGLAERGHEVHVAEPSYVFGQAHVMDVTEDVLAGSTDARAIIGAADGY
jgi:gamma-glutamyltranspeptidase